MGKCDKFFKWFLHEAKRLTQCMIGFEVQVRLTLIALNLEGSLLAYCLRTCLAAKPNEHKPCRMGDLKPEPNSTF